MRFTRLSVLALCLPVLGFAQDAKPEGGAKPDTSSVLGMINSLQSEINIDGAETSYDPLTGVASAKGDVHIVYGDTEIMANRADYNANTGDVKASGSVTVVKAGVTYQSESIVYNVKTSQLTGADVRSSTVKDDGHLLYSLKDLSTTTQDIEKIEGEEAFFTTNDLADPNFRVTAKRMTIYPGDRVVMHNVKIYAGKTPVFWLPYLSQPIDDELGYRFVPGYSANWGAFLLNQYGVIHGDHTLATYRLDLRSSRGVAVGADFESLKQRGNSEWGKIKFYYASDSDPTLNHTNENRGDVTKSRYRINFQHRIYITGPAERTWYLDFDINKISDPYFYEDYFMDEYRSNREPDNQVSLVRSDPRYTATLMAKFQLNDFYRTDTRLPELAFDFTRQPIMNTGVFFQGNTSYGILEEKRGSIERNLNKSLQAQAQDFIDSDGATTLDEAAIRRTIGFDPSKVLGVDDVSLALARLTDADFDRQFNRFHTYNEFLYPTTAFGWLSFVPRFGVGYQNYSSVSGGPGAPSSADRALFQAGFDLSFKASRTWDDIKNDKLGLDGLKHVVQPYINYSYLNADDINNLPTIDRNAPTTRPRPLDIPFYTGIDSLRNWNVARIGVRNLFQTRRDYSSQHDDEERQFREATTQTSVQTYNWAGINTYVDVFFDDPEFNRDVSNLYNELFWRPVPWLTFFADTQLPIGGSDANFTEANYGVTWMPNDSLSITLGHQFLDNHPFFQNSSLVYSRIYAKLNENWGFSMNHIYEMDDSTLEYQSYSLHRDLNSWVASFGALVRDNRGQSDFGFIFSLTLKEFPTVTIPMDTDPNPTGRGGGAIR